jgi:transposase
LRDWLSAFGVTHVAMEATGVYWQPVWHVLEDDFELTLCNARHVKQVPGRKTDISDAQWLCQLMEAGLLRGSFVPPKPQRQLRTLTRYRKTQIAERQREANRLHKALEDTGIKLDCVATDILGKSGRAMLDALVNGTIRSPFGERAHVGGDVLDDADELVADRPRLEWRLAAVVPEIRSANAGEHDAHDRVGRFSDRSVGAVACCDVAGLVEDGSAHGLRLLRSFSVRSQTHLGTRAAKLGDPVKGVLTGHPCAGSGEVC